MITVEQFNKRGEGFFPRYVGLLVTQVGEGEIRSELKVEKHLMAPNGFLHAGSIVTLADTSCGYGCFATMPQGATGFTTIELKSNHLGTAREGTILCHAKAAHLGKTTQVWDAVVSHQETGKTIALFRCTQMILYPQPSKGE